MTWAADHRLSTWVCPASVFAFAVGLWLLARLLPTPRPGPPKRTAAAWVVVFGLLFLLGGVAALAGGTIAPILRARRAAGWPTTSGTVLGSRLAARSGGKGTTYTIEIGYRYAVDGRTYDGTRYDAATLSTGFRSAKQAIVDAHPPGRPVTVHYDPADPADAMLSTAVPPGTYLMIPVDAFMIAIGGFATRDGVRDGRRRGFWTMAVPSLGTPGQG